MELKIGTSHPAEMVNDARGMAMQDRQPMN